MAYSEPNPNKPHKVCPEVVTAKDTPCRTLKASSTVAVRLMEGPEGKPGLADENKKLKESIIQHREVINQLLSRIKELEEQNVPLSNN